MTDLVGALEIGGSHVSSGVVDPARAEVVSGIRRFALAADSSRESLLETISGAALAVTVSSIAGWGVAVPGPFDYEHGVSRIRGVAKLDALYGVDLRDRLSRDLNLERRERVRFLNDAHAFLLGDWWAGSAKGHARAMGVTLGTGIGSGFLANGELVVSGPHIPPEARLDLVPFRGAPVEDVLSSRGIVSAFGDELDVAEIARRARNGDPKALALLRAFGSALGEFLEPWIARFAPTCLVFGGSITRAWDLFGDSFREACPAAARLQRCGPAEQLVEAPLLGAALHAVRPQSASA